MQKFFQVCVTDRAPLPVSKKWGSVAVEKPAAGQGGGAVRAEAGARVGALVVINALFHVYFAINNLRLCQNLIRAVEGPAFPKAPPPQHRSLTQTSQKPHRRPPAAPRHASPPPPQTLPAHLPIRLQHLSRDTRTRLLPTPPPHTSPPRRPATRAPLHAVRRSTGRLSRGGTSQRRRSSRTSALPPLPRHFEALPRHFLPGHFLDTSGATGREAATQQQSRRLSPLPTSLLPAGPARAPPLPLPSLAGWPGTSRAGWRCSTPTLVSRGEEAASPASTPPSCDAR